MSKTNSNSITSILVIALNTDDSDFRKKMLELLKDSIEKKANIKIDDKIIKKTRFYNSTHSPLPYPEMNDKEIDIIARVPGVHKPIMMIEVKANTDETLQDSQSKGKEYQKTSEVHGIPLVYIIPKEYRDIKKLPCKPHLKKAKNKNQNAIILFWEDLKEITKNLKEIRFDGLIDTFIELTDESKKIQLNKFQKTALEDVKKIIKNNNIYNISDLQCNQWGIGYYFSTNRPKADYFIGFTPDYKEDKKFLSLCIAENRENIDLGDRDDNPKVAPMFFNDGWYYFPLGKNKLNKNIKIPKEDEKFIDKNILNAIIDNRKKINELIKNIRNNFK